MNHLIKAFVCVFAYLIMGIGNSFAAASINQTPDTSLILPAAGLPFRVIIEQANFQLPVGFHSGVVGVYKNYWVFIAGRINGLHGFGPDPFPADQQNTSIYVVNYTTGAVYSRALNDPTSGLDQRQIDTLSVTSPQGYQENNTLYMSGGYGIDTATSTFETKPVLTAFNLPGVVAWVTQPGNKSLSLTTSMTQLYNPIFQITGGRMFKLNGVMQLVFGQNFAGVYTPGRNGDYSDQVRQFQLSSTGSGQLVVNILNRMPSSPDSNFRRRDLNILPTLLHNNSSFLQPGLIAYAGVFTDAGGVWTVPVVINGKDNPQMADPTLPTTFKQGMNQYICATASLYSNRSASMYHIFFGGISYGFYSGGTFQTNTAFPFINQVTTIKMDKDRNFTQYIMDNEYPTILSTGSNPGNTLLFGAGAYFMPANILKYQNQIINLDNIHQPTVIGYIVGGIQSTLPNTNPKTDTAASPYVFKVTLVPT